MIAVAASSIWLAACGGSLDNPQASALGSVEPGGVGAAAFAGPGAGEKGNGNPGSGASTASLSKVATQLTSSSTPGSEGYKVGAQDVLEVSVFKVPELSKTVQVADAGSINLPLVGEVPAAGRTARDIERDLTKRLGDKYLQSPQVTVFVKEYNSRRVTVEGAVKKPGVIPYRGSTSLIQVVAMAEGLSEFADSEVVVFRQAGDKRTAARFDLEAIRAGTADDPQVLAGDVVVVGKSAFKEAYGQFLKSLPAVGVFGALL